MKKTLLFGALCLTAGTAFAQTAQIERNNGVVTGSGTSYEAIDQRSAAKTTGQTAPFYYVTSAYLTAAIDNSDIPYGELVTPVDTGYIFGHNRYGNRAYAEKFAFSVGSSSDTTLQILGFRAVFTGTVTPASSSKTVTFHVWSVAGQTSAGTKKFNAGLPNTSLKSMTRNFRQLGIGNNNPDTIMNYMFPTPLTGVKTSFFLGFELPSYNYASLGSDTVTIRAGRANTGIGVGYIPTGSDPSNPDTLLVNKNVYRNAAGTWADQWYNYGLNRNISIVPIVQLSSSNIPNSVASVSKANLTFYGNYPNPAVNSTTVRVGLKKGTDVTIEITDIAGRTISTTTHKGLNAGEHHIKLETSALPTGTYVYVVRTADGDAIASQMTIAK